MLKIRVQNSSGDRYFIASQMENFDAEFNAYMSCEKEINRPLRLRTQKKRITSESDEQIEVPSPKRYNRKYSNKIMQFLLENISGNHFCSEINDSYDVSAQFSVFDDERLPSENEQNVNSCDRMDGEISTSAATQSKQIR